MSPSITLVTVAEIKDGSFSDSFSFPSIFEVLAGVLKEEGSNVFEVVGVFSVEHDTNTTKVTIAIIMVYLFIRTRIKS